MKLFKSIPMSKWLAMNELQRLDYESCYIKAISQNNEVFLYEKEIPQPNGSVTSIDLPQHQAGHLPISNPEPSFDPNIFGSEDF